METKRMTRAAADQIAQLVTERLEAGEILQGGPCEFPAEAFHAFRARVHEAFYVPETSITPVMARVLFAIAANHRPRRVLVVGSYAGNAMVWLAGPSIHGMYEAEGVWGVDIDPGAVRLAKTNFMALQAPPYVQQVCCDGHDVAETIGGTFDLLYIDVESEGKRTYHTLLERLYPLLPQGALVLAHDAAVETFKEDLVPYMAMVRDKKRFRRSALLNIDHCGVEVTLK